VSKPLLVTLAEHLVHLDKIRFGDFDKADIDHFFSGDFPRIRFKFGTPDQLPGWLNRAGAA
jgi:hypothetical protein